MNKDVLKLKPQNLPVYVYRLDASVAFILNRVVYKLLGYNFAKITIAANQPLREGDVLDNSCCYYGNENTEIITHLCISKVLGGAEEELRYYCGCRIDKLAISYAGEYDRSCGDGKCTVFIELSTSALLDSIKRLEEKSPDLESFDIEALDAMNEEYLAAGSIEYWRNRVPNWDKLVECVGEVPDNLIY